LSGEQNLRRGQLACAGLTTLPSTSIAPPRIAGAPVSFECRTLHMLETGPGQSVVIGEVLVAHIDDAFILDPERYYVDTLAMGLIARMHGSGWYARSTDLFQMKRPTYADWCGFRRSRACIPI
jgi:flavin reductase (DIM6/NTAB) family NADH-FMN oxidoreductase RutF